MEEDNVNLGNRELWDASSDAAAQAASIETQRTDPRWDEVQPIKYDWELGQGSGWEQRVILANFGDGDIPFDDAASFVGELRELLLLIIAGYFDAVRFLYEDDKVIASYAQDGDGKWRKEQPDEC